MIYKHFKGGYYLKLTTARDCNSPTTSYVVYKALQDNGDFKKGQNWLREENEFNDIHPVAKVKRLRQLTLVETLLYFAGLKKFIK